MSILDKVLTVLVKNKEMLNILIVEDSRFDAELIILKLEQEGFQFKHQWVETESDYLKALETNPDIILSDWSLPQFSGMLALKLMKEKGYEIPFIIISGSIGDEAAVTALHEGVYDYVLKDRPERIGQAVRNALEQKKTTLENWKANEALKASEAELRALFSSMRDVVIVIDDQGVYQKIAPTNPDLLVKPANELLGTSISEIFPEHQAKEFIKEINLVLSSGKTRQIEYMLRITGKDFWFETAISPMTTDSVVWVARDITGRKQAEANLHLQSEALNAAANTIVITNNDGEIHWVNPAFTQLTGYSPDEVIGKNPRLLNSGVHPVSFFQDLWNTILAGKVWHGELINQRKDGSQYTEEETITPLFDSNGNITHFISIKQDITDRKNAEKDLQRYAQRQEKIAALGRELASTLEMDQIYRLAEQYVKEMTEFSIFGITLFDAKKELLMAAYYKSDEELVDLNLLPPLRYNPQQSSSARTRAIYLQEPVIINDLVAKRKMTASLKEGNKREPQSAIYIPMVAEGQVIGLFDLKSYQKNAYEEKDAEWLSVVANQIGMTIQNARLFERVQTRVEELTALSNIDAAMTSHLDQKEIFSILLEQVVKRLEVDAAVLLLYQHESEMLEFASQVGYKNLGIEKLQLRKGESLSGQVAESKKTMHIRHLREENANLLLTPTREEGFEDFIGVPLMVESKLIGVLELFNRTQIQPDDDWLRFLDILVGQAAIVIDHVQLVNELQVANQDLLQAYDATIVGWSQAMDLRDKETEGHTQRVTELSIKLATVIGFETEELIQIRRGALLHDIGKLGIPDSILHKPGPLTEEEWLLMKRHPELAKNMLAQVEYLKPAMDIPYCHHEHWDGSGYPQGLKGEEIPIAARVFAVIDVWDALTSERPYRPAWSKEKTLQFIKDQSGKYFDPKILDIFIQKIVPNLIAK